MDHTQGGRKRQPPTPTRVDCITKNHHTNASFVPQPATHQPFPSLLYRLRNTNKRKPGAERTQPSAVRPPERKGRKASDNKGDRRTRHLVVFNLLIFCVVSFLAG